MPLLILHIWNIGYLNTAFFFFNFGLFYSWFIIIGLVNYLLFCNKSAFWDNPMEGNHFDWFLVDIGEPTNSPGPANLSKCIYKKIYTNHRRHLNPKVTPPVVCKRIRKSNLRPTPRSTKKSNS